MPSGESSMSRLRSRPPVRARTRVANSSRRRGKSSVMCCSFCPGSAYILSTACQDSVSFLLQYAENRVLLRRLQLPGQSRFRTVDAEDDLMRMCGRILLTAVTVLMGACTAQAGIY